MAEEAKQGKTVEATIGLAVIVSSFIYIQEQLLREHLVDVLIAVLVFGIGIVFLYKQLK